MNRLKPYSNTFVNVNSALKKDYYNRNCVDSKQRLTVNYCCKAFHLRRLRSPGYASGLMIRLLNYSHITKISLGSLNRTSTPRNCLYERNRPAYVRRLSNVGWILSQVYMRKFSHRAWAFLSNLHARKSINIEVNLLQGNLSYKSGAC